MNFIYADNAATTKISDEVFEAMLPFLKDSFGNPSSLYTCGREARRAVENSRRAISDTIGALPKEIIFTSGGTESDNTAIKSAALSGAQHGKKHIITSAFEHPAVLNTCRELEKRGFEVTYLPVSSDGFVDPADAEKAMREETAIVSIMAANNETGTIQPISEIGRICRQRNIPFHTDAVQAFGNIPINVNDLYIDMMSVSGHKIHAPKGVGFLYVRSGTDFLPFMRGGAQERSRRAGTENTAGIAALGKACEIAVRNISERSAALIPIRDKIIGELLKIPGSRLNGSLENRLCGNINMSFPGAEGETLVLMLDMKGICASSGSACASGSSLPSHVLKAIGLSDIEAQSSLRLTIGEDISEENAERIIECVADCVSRIRNRLSP